MLNLFLLGFAINPYALPNPKKQCISRPFTKEEKCRRSPLPRSARRQPIPLSLNKVSKVLGQPDVYVYDCNPEDIYEKSHLKGSIHANKADWMNLLPKDKKNSFVILYCINRMCTVSFEAALEAINAGYENVYVMPDGIQGWVSNGYPFEGTSWKPYESKAPVLLQRKD